MTSNHEILNLFKTNVGHHEYGEEKVRDEVDRIDALVTAPQTTIDSFADLDEKKILRKVDIFYYVQQISTTID